MSPHWAMQAARLFLDQYTCFLDFVSCMAALDALAGFAVATHPQAAPAGCSFCRPIFAAAAAAVRGVWVGVGYGCSCLGTIASVLPSSMVAPVAVCDSGSSHHQHGGLYRTHRCIRSIEGVMLPSEKAGMACSPMPVQTFALAPPLLLLQDGSGPAPPLLLENLWNPQLVFSGVTHIEPNTLQLGGSSGPATLLLTGAPLSVCCRVFKACLLGLFSWTSPQV